MTERKKTILVCGGCRGTSKPFETTLDESGDKKMDRHIADKHKEWKVKS